MVGKAWYRLLAWVLRHPAAATFGALVLWAALTVFLQHLDDRREMGDYTVTFLATLSGAPLLAIIVTTIMARAPELAKDQSYADALAATSHALRRLAVTRVGYDRMPPALSALRRAFRAGPEGADEALMCLAIGTAAAEFRRAAAAAREFEAKYPGAAAQDHLYELLDASYGAGGSYSDPVWQTFDRDESVRKWLLDGGDNAGRGEVVLASQLFALDRSSGELSRSAKRAVTAAKTWAATQDLSTRKDAADAAELWSLRSSIAKLDRNDLLEMREELGSGIPSASSEMWLAAEDVLRTWTMVMWGLCRLLSAPVVMPNAVQEFDRH